MLTLSKVEKRLVQDVLEKAVQNICSQIGQRKISSDNLIELSRISFIYQIFSRLSDLEIAQEAPIPAILYEDLVSFVAGSKLSVNLKFELGSLETPFNELVEQLRAGTSIEQVFNLSNLYGAVLNFNLIRGKNDNEYRLLSGNAKRKQSGSYFTPPRLVEKLVDEVVAELVRGDFAESKSINLKIVDPACGPGIFLVAALEKIGDKTGLDKQVVSEMIYGVDSDCAAVFLARMNLWNSVDCLSPHVFREKVKLGNSLIGSVLNEKDDKRSLDENCASWFSTDAAYNVASLKKRYRFFHWRKEFAQVFEEKGGFDAVIGNPPWEIAKPNSREFFAQFDSQFYSYPKQKALAVQNQILQTNQQAKDSWYQNIKEKKLISNWVKNAPLQFTPHTEGFQYQGKGDFNLYKSFLEQAYYLSAYGGIISFVVPSGLYCDRGGSELRKLFLEKCNWISLTAFENTDNTFKIHRSFKYCYFVVRKAESSGTIKAIFLNNLKKAETSGSIIKYSAGLVKQFSPISNIILEVENDNVLELLDKIYSSSSYLYETEYGGTRLKYARELDMTTDSHMFVKRTQLEHHGFIQDQYGNWLKEETGEVYVPLYEGRMVGQYDFSKKRWLTGSGRSAIWEDNHSRTKNLEPQYLVKLEDFRSERIVKGLKTGFLAVGSDTNSRTMISACLNEVACGNAVPVFTFESKTGDADLYKKNRLQLLLTAVFNSFVFDFVLRRRMAGTNLNYFVIEECPLPKILDLNSAVVSKIVELAARLNFTSPRYANPLSVLGLNASFVELDPPNKKLFKAALDTLVQYLYGLSFNDMTLIFDGFNVDYKSKTNKKQFDLSIDDDVIAHFGRASERFLSKLANNGDLDLLTFTEKQSCKIESNVLNPKGFYRVDKDLPVTRRQTYLTLLLAKIMESSGIEQYLNILDNLSRFPNQIPSSQITLSEHTDCLSNLLGA